ncbi:serrate RNA effector molecule homolog isoform X2 [Teleopsis dalmanni]|uniref:serrate RNA effector molecule homolog isoform X2 n=1 Tax=Teleopsis dalmanni TaxID=139649 RepID=UPI0018CE1600|nr:serrate RNA effector molecule homolog isoform X2 [Teleopsis dalmanni]
MIFEMADSDDEYDRKRRDKFRGERSSGDSYRSERRDERRTAGSNSRDDWPERNPFRGGGGGGGRARPEYRDYRGGRDRYGSPGRDMPPAKRMRSDWGDDIRPRYAGYDPYMMQAWNEHYAHSMHNAYGAHLPHASVPSRDQTSNNDTLTQPAMLTLKQFLDTQDDSISDSEVLRKYSDYKLDFKRQQLNEFFVTHKDEEWFKSKYHPIESVKRKEEQLNFLKKRVEVFTELLDDGQVQKVSVDTNQTEPLLRLLDTVVIKLEGGTEDDLKILDEKPKEIILPDRFVADKKKDENDDDVIITSVGKKQDDYEPAKIISPRPMRREQGSDEDNWDEDDDDDASDKKSVDHKELPEKIKRIKSHKRKRASSDSSSDSSTDSDSSRESSSDDDDADEKTENKYDLESVKNEEEDRNTPNDENDNQTTEEVKLNSPEETLNESVEDKIDDDSEVKKDDSKDIDAVLAMDTNDDDKVEQLQDISINNDSENEKALEKEIENEKKEEEKESTADKDSNLPETIDLDKEKDGPQPRALHRTSSIFLRNLAPAITKTEIESICQRYSGFLRVAIADPSVERRWYRRGWITFQRDVNIKEICWNLNNVRLRECEMGAIVNRDLSRRVRPVNGITAHKTVVRSDIKMCAKIALNLDEKHRLWCDLNAEANGNDNARSNGNADSSTYGFKSNNPVLQNITDFLIEEASAEEDELLGISGDAKDNEGEVIERDPQLLSVLDNLILYLRVVHSVDFYNHCEYPYEDEMPNRCGIIHARGPPPTKINANDIQDYIKTFETKLQTLLTQPKTVEDEELKNLGAKDPETEVEKFVLANTQELSKDKWLCPLSGKKFKGPEFIRKHIFNKHSEKVEEVRKEVEYFNNYLKDPKRPQLPEHPGTNKRTNSESSGGYRPHMYPPAYAAPYGAYAPPLMLAGRGGRGFANPRRPHKEYRQLIQYRDLDAPQDAVDMLF